MLSALGIEFRSPFVDEETFPDLDEILKGLDDIGIRISIQECVPEKDSKSYQVDTTNPFSACLIIGGDQQSLSALTTIGLHLAM